MAAEKRALIIMTRAPLLGRVKTQIALELGDPVALEAHRILGSLVTRAVSDVPNCDKVIAFTPSIAAVATRQWLGRGFEFESQSAGDLGDRMASAISRRFDLRANRVVLVGIDCPEINSTIVEQAFDLLGHTDVVFGPNCNGGYYLVGVRRPLPLLFAGLPWGSDTILRLSLERASSLGASVALLDERRDIDTADDWRAFAREPAAGGKCPQESTPGPPPN